MDESPIPLSGTSDSEPDAPETPEFDVEKELITRMDAAALAFSEAMMNYERTEDGKDYKISWEFRVEVFKLVKEWISTRRRHDISEEENGREVKGMRSRLTQLQAAANAPKINKDGLPARPNGRPTNERKALYDKMLQEKDAERQAASKNDDSDMRKRLAKLSASNGAAK